MLGYDPGAALGLWMSDLADDPTAKEARKENGMKKSFQMIRQIMMLLKEEKFGSHLMWAPSGTMGHVLKRESGDFAPQSTFRSRICQPSSVEGGGPLHLLDVQNSFANLCIALQPEFRPTGAPDVHAPSGGIYNASAHNPKSVRITASRYTDFTGYRIYEKIDETPNASVFKALRVADNKPVILKALDKDFPTIEDLQRYRAEFHLLRLASHIPGVITAIALETFKNDLTAMVLEDIGGPSIWQWMVGHGLETGSVGNPHDDLDDSRSHLDGDVPLSKLPVEEVLRISLVLGRTLADLHEIPIIHKDITPQNIIWNPQTGEVRLIDFALAFHGRMERPYEMQGTMAWIPPEQTARINRSVDRRSDLFGLGGSMYTMLCGRTPYGTSDPLELLHCVMALDPPPITDEKVPPMLGKIVMKLLKKAPEDRYQSAEGLVADLEYCLECYLRDGTIPEFELGEYDLRALEIPSKLYGREHEIQEIHRSFEDVASRNQPEILMVSGYSGIGKTTIVWEAIGNGLLQRRGNFIKGKFEQMRTQPYHAILRGFGEFLKGLLREEQSVVAAWKQRFERVQTRLSTIIVDLIPELAYFVDATKMENLPAAQALERFSIAFFEFIMVFLEEDRPLVLFLDDMQWADLASLKLIEIVMDNISSNHVLYNYSSHPFLFIGSYRSNEVGPGHPLMNFLDRNRDLGEIQMETINLQPLTHQDVALMIADTVHKPDNDRGLQELASTVFEKAGGNPFYIKQLLTKMYDERMFTQVCDRISRRFAWSWDMTRIRTLGIMENVADILVKTIHDLPEQSRVCLQWAGCFGTTFTLEDLCAMLERSAKVVARDLQTPIDRGLIAPRTFFSSRITDDMNDETVSRLIKSDRPGYVFLHDKIRQAAYSMNTQEELARIHLSIGRVLKARLVQRDDPGAGTGGHQKLIFQVLDNYAKGFDLIKDESELGELSQLSYEAGKQACSTGAYNLGYRYFARALEIKMNLRGNRPLKSQIDPDYRYIFNLHYAAAEAAYLSLQYEETQRLVQLMDSYVENPLDKARVQTLQVRQAMARDKPQETIMRSLLVLDNLGVHIPRDPSTWTIRQLQNKVKAFLKGKTDDDLVNRMETTTEIDNFIISILKDLLTYTLNYEPRLYAAIALNYALITMRTGSGAYGYVIYATILSSLFNDYDGAYRFCKIAIKRIHTSDTKPRTYVYALSFGLDYKESVREGLPLAITAHDLANEHGDSEEMALTALKLGFIAWWGGISVRTFREELAGRIIQTFRIINRPMQQRWIAPYLQGMDCLANDVGDPSRLSGEWMDFDEELEKPASERFEGDATALLISAGIETVLCFLWRDYDRAWRDIVLIKDARKRTQSYRLSDHVPILWYELLVRIRLLGVARSHKLRDQKSLDVEPDVVMSSSELSTSDLALSETGTSLTDDGVMPREWSKIMEVRQLYRIKKELKALKSFADMAEMNHKHRYLLACAELAAYQHDISALQLYEDAAKQAQDRSFYWEYAMIRELQMEFLLSKGNEISAKQLFREAVYYYQKDGVLAKKKHLENLHPNLVQTKVDLFGLPQDRMSTADTGHHGFATVVGGGAGESIDVLSLFKATQAISRQVSFDKLLEMLAGIYLETSGAQRAVFCNVTRGPPRIVAEGFIDNTSESETTRSSTVITGLNDAATGAVHNGKRASVALRGRRTPSTEMSASSVSLRRPSQAAGVESYGPMTSTPPRRPSTHRLPVVSPTEETALGASGAWTATGPPSQMQTQSLPLGYLPSPLTPVKEHVPSNGWIPTTTTQPNGGAYGQATPNGIRRGSATLEAGGNRGVTGRRGSNSNEMLVLKSSRRGSAAGNELLTREPNGEYTTISPSVADTNQARRGSMDDRASRRGSGDADMNHSGALSVRRRESGSDGDQSDERLTPPNVKFALMRRNADSDMLPMSVLNYCLRTKETVVLDNAMTDARFGSDVYSQVTGAVYLEHRNLSGVFTPERLYVLNIMFGQAAVSLENARLYSSINKFVPDDMIAQLNHESVLTVQLGDCIEKDMTVMFSDIRDFTNLSESMNARKTLSFLNAYLSKMQPLIEQNKGIVDKYFGDGILALWNDPDGALDSAIFMQRELQRFNASNLSEKNYHQRETRVGIGFNSGRLMLGAIGARNRIDVSVIGDTVNLGSRVEGLTKFYHVDCLVSEHTYVRLKNPNRFNFRMIDLVRAKGKMEAIKIYELIDGEYDEKLRARKVSIRNIFSEAVNLYQRKNFMSALQKFDECWKLCPEDYCTRMYRDRCKKMLQMIADGVNINNWEPVEIMFDK
ncbi:hypothetical protein M427DRAFT_42141 [Gonapodya prolifera JEL478]|uniref:Uncharacterized protein n=1 Tax=Gonapodya prolifera (strain JEL478) TaxID=1344416 RepID=A0A139AQR1_GONPJ|nr:hypothetical protein M427DRAFT_42141 [Gonapodya prolifera JEL478]|eukprot:KXS18843.1 hypothetical protein M427DRAFT_42141 [Gonapodya prolifera JEL478]